MNVVILHCHYERGGVTQVVENHVRSLHQSGRVERIVLIAGGRTSGLADSTLDTVEQITVEGFDYDTDAAAGSAVERGDQLADRLQTALTKAAIDRDRTVLHWHNHSLGKNAGAPQAIVRLALQGWRLLLQIHDFAEDNRPHNYGHLIEQCGAQLPAELDAYLYPCAAQIHYAGLTSADAGVIASLGVPSRQTHCLPNSVAPPSAESVDHDGALAKVRKHIGLPPDARWCLYPVRGIRRKNVGELLLLSRWLDDDMYAGLTLCPATPIEKRSYQRWRDLAGDLAPRAVFDAANHDGLSFAENLAAAEFALSTSVAEGFGMAFLEPWLAARRVIARRLPTVTEDFEKSGVNLSQLYDEIPVPGDADWLTACRREIGDAFHAAWSAVPKAFRPSDDSVTTGDADNIDFARLTPARQIEVLRRAHTDRGFERDLMTRSASLVQNLRADAAAHDDLITRNADVITQNYAVEKQSKALLAIYAALLQTEPERECQPPLRDRLAIDLVSQVRPYFPCRTEVIADEGVR